MNDYYKIDVHHHYVLPELYKNTNIKNKHILSPEYSIKIMNKYKIKKAYLSLPAPGLFFNDIKITAEICRKCNVYAAEIKDKYPGRFGVFAVLPFPCIKASLEEVSYSLDTLKLDGVILYSNYNGIIPDNDNYKEVFIELNKRRTVVFLHPEKFNIDEFKNNPAYNIDFEYSNDISRFITTSLYNGIFEKYSKIKFVLAHGGGIVPFFSQRISRVYYLNGNKLRWNKILVDMIKNKNSGLEILKNFYYECSGVTDDCNISSLLELTGKSNILYGSNYGENDDIENNINYEINDKLINEDFYVNNAEQLFKESLKKNY